MRKKVLTALGVFETPSPIHFPLPPSRRWVSSGGGGGCGQWGSAEQVVGVCVWWVEVGRLLSLDSRQRVCWTPLLRRADAEVSRCLQNKFHPAPSHFPFRLIVSSVGHFHVFRDLKLNYVCILIKKTKTFVFFYMFVFQRCGLYKQWILDFFSSCKKLIF